MKAAGVVLAGGRSSRMGSPKAALEWHGSTLLRRVSGVVRRAVDGPVVVVAAPGQELPDAGDVEVVRDEREGEGPLRGLAAGLSALADRADVAFVCSTDLPFLHVDFVRATLRPLYEPHEPADSGTANGAALDVVLPVVGGYRQPLAAAYRTALAPVVGTLLDGGSRRPAHLLDRCRVRVLDEADLLGDPRLAQHDPQLRSVAGVNTPDDYAAARTEPAPAVVVECFGVLAAAAGRGPRRVEAATLGAAAATVGLELGPHVVAAIGGDQMARDPELPLVAGDTVSFVSADAGG